VTGWPKPILPMYSRGAAISDLENDGTLEIALVTTGGNTALTSPAPLTLFILEEAAPGGVKKQSLFPTDRGNNQRTGVVAQAYARAFPRMNVRGTYNSWGVTPMRQTGDHTWAVNVTFPSGAQSFKFDAYGNWVTNWGDNAPADGVANAGGSNIAVTGGATYRITFNDTTLAYSAVQLATTAPAAPTGVSATATSSSAVTVSWTAPSGATSYKVYRATSASGPFTTPIASGIAGTSFGDTGLTANTTYYYNVKATNSAGDSAASSTVPVTTPAGGFTSSYATMFLRGTMNGWGTSGMTLVANNTWQVSVPLSAMTYQYKYDAYGDWAGTTNWGDNSPTDGVGDPGGSNIDYTASTAGTYLFTFDDATRAFSVVKQ
jgi:hypothetical protein